MEPGQAAAAVGQPELHHGLVGHPAHGHVPDDQRVVAPVLLVSAGQDGVAAPVPGHGRARATRAGTQVAVNQELAVSILETDEADPATSLACG